MTVDNLRDELQALRQVCVALANIGKLEEHAFGTHQGLVLQCLDRAVEYGEARTQVLRAAAPEFEMLLDLAERDDLALSKELVARLSEAREDGFTTRQPNAQRPVKALAQFAREPEIRHSVFVDESGTPSFDEARQPVLSMVGILVDDDQIPKFASDVEGLLTRYGLPSSTEIHTYDCVCGEGSFATLSQEHRYELLKEFISLGIVRAIGVHYISMLKLLVAEDTRARMKRLRLDPYSNLAIWFN